MRARAVVAGVMRTARQIRVLGVRRVHGRREQIRVAGQRHACEPSEELEACGTGCGVMPGTVVASRIAATYEPEGGTGTSCQKGVGWRMVSQVESGEYRRENEKVKWRGDSGKKGLWWFRSVSRRITTADAFQPQRTHQAQTIIENHRGGACSVCGVCVCACGRCAGVKAAKARAKATACMPCGGWATWGIMQLFGEGVLGGNMSA